MPKHVSTKLRLSVKGVILLLLTTEEKNSYRHRMITEIKIGTLCKVTYESEPIKDFAKNSTSLIIKSEVPFFILIKEIKVAMRQLKSEVSYGRVPI